MGKQGYKGKGGGARRRRDTAGSEEEHGGKKWEARYLQAVDSKWHFGKASLRAYASENGSPFYTKGKSDAEHLSLNTLLDRLHARTSEACNRMGVALSEAGGTVCMMAEFVDKYLADPDKAAGKLGILALADEMGPSKSKQLREAATALDKNSSSEKPKMTVQDAAKAWVKYFTEDGKTKAKPWQRLARSAATQYVFAMEMLQWLALGKDLKAWADKVKEQNKELQPEEVQKWLRGPSSHDRLAAALAASYVAQVSKKAKRAGGLSSEATDTDASKARKSKDKKKRQRSTSSKPSRSTSAKASSSTGSKKAKKEKKDAKKHKKDKSKDKKSEKKSDKKHKKQKTDSSDEQGSADSAGQASPSAPAPIKFKLFQTVDEGQNLEVDGKKYKNCCLALALARATLGGKGTKEEIQAWARDWISKLPENKQKACRLPAREASAGEALYDDYLQFEIDAAPSLPKVVFLVDTAQRCTKVWATEAATKLEDIQPVYIRHEGYHYTALLAQSDDLTTLLKDLPALDAHSFVGPDELLLACVKAQKK